MVELQSLLMSYLFLSMDFNQLLIWILFLYQKLLVTFIIEVSRQVKFHFEFRILLSTAILPCQQAPTVSCMAMCEGWIGQSLVTR